MSVTDEAARAKLMITLNAQAEVSHPSAPCTVFQLTGLSIQAKAKELGMKPAFKCSAAKQRKKPYSLDPNNADIVIPISISRFLRRYQRVGVHFFYDRYVGIKVDNIGIVRGGVLGDDMGLGKTIQVLGFVRSLEISRTTLNICQLCDRSIAVGGDGQNRDRG